MYGLVIQDDPVHFPPTEFALLACAHTDCQVPIVQYRSDWGEGFERDKPEIYYPSRQLLNSNIPEALQDEFEEARKCL